MPKCTKVDCEKPGTRALKLEFYADTESVPVTAFINLPVCDEHNLTDDEVREFLRINWEVLCMGFDQVGKLKPDPTLTKFEWAPWTEAEEFWREGTQKPRTTFRKN